MDHEQATTQQAVERYLLGELTTAEAEEFELHFFACSECSEALEAGALLAENARAVLTAESARRAPAPQPEESQPSWWDRLRAVWTQPLVAAPAAAAVLLAAVVSYQALVVIPGLNRQLGEVRPLPSFPLVASARGDEGVIAVSRSQPYFILYLDPPAGATYPSYRAEIAADRGPAFSVVVPAPPPGQPVNLLIPAKALAEGNYKLILRGISNPSDAKTETGTYTFTLKYR